MVTTSGPVPVRPDALGAPTIGTPLPNTSLYILDEHLEPVPDGVPGELFISGDGLARGYLDRPELTAERFLPNPFSDDPHARMYRTGDRVRYLPSGELAFLGPHRQSGPDSRARESSQERSAARLASTTRFLDAVTVAGQDSALGTYLVSYAVTRSRPPATELRDFLERLLPAHMVPARIVCLDELPMTPNGKVDIAALPTPKDISAQTDRTFQAPRTETEEAVAKAWSQILGRSRISVYDDFFELGGHSLVAAQIISRANRRFAVDLPLQAIFDAPTIESFAAWIDRSRRETRRRAAIVHEETPGDLLRRIDALSDEEVEKRLQEIVVKQSAPSARRARLTALLEELSSRPREAPVSYSQRRLWRILHGSDGGSFHNLGRVLRIRGPLDEGALKRSLEALVQRHEMLRTVFPARDEQPVQRILPSLEVAIEHHVVSESDPARRMARAHELVREESKQSFELSQGPLFRVLLIDMGQEDRFLALILFHIIVDGWSMKVIARELSALYQAFAQGQPSPLPPLTIQYADFATWQRRELDDQALEGPSSYWREQLHGARADLDLPTTYARPAEPDHEGAIHISEIPAELSHGVQRVAGAEGATPYMAFLSAFNVLLWHYTKQEDILLISTNAGRTRPEIEQLIGFFVNPLAMRTDLRGDPSFRELLRRVRKTVLDARRNQEAPLDVVLEQVSRDRESGHGPRFQVLFDYQEAVPAPESWPGLEVGEWEMVDKGTALIDLAVAIETQSNGIIKTMFQYPTGLFSEAAIADMSDRLHRLLRRIVDDPERPVSELARFAPDDARS